MLTISQVQLPIAISPTNTLDVNPWVWVVFMWKLCPTIILRLQVQVNAKLMHKIKQILFKQCAKVPNAKKALLKAPRKYAHETRKLRRC